ncbi:MAG: hypothetical protein B6244_04745 [Candidatus Cloacimonetes bacterium 4572_55]|nr:MAG: hypothetical protein B6244_04745 [Candidatus Cloacimonetes bacterium 4572_55]
MKSNPLKQIPTLFPTLIKLYTPAVLLIIFVLVGRFHFKIAIQKFTRDPAAIFSANPFYGILSNMGVLAWCATAAICFFAAVALRKRDPQNAYRPFFLHTAILTTILLFDDLLMFHETVFPRFLHLPEKVVLLTYVVMLVFLIYRYRFLILQTDFILLLIALGFFAFSVAVDILIPYEVTGQYLLEDGLKLFGIFGWLGYFARTCYQKLEEA